MALGAPGFFRVVVFKLHRFVLIIIFVLLAQLGPEIFTYRIPPVHILAIMPLKFLILMAAMKPHGLILAILRWLVYNGELRLELVQNLRG
jgi:hypothetical protein